MGEGEQGVKERTGLSSSEGGRDKGKREGRVERERRRKGDAYT